MAYTKLDNGITDSTIWQAPDHTRIVWITMLAMADQNGYIGASVPGLAGRARVPLDACVIALESFLSPDKWSRTKDYEGRRIAEAEGGWVLLNHAKYRAAQNAEDRRERSRIAMAELRKKRKHSPTVSSGEPPLTKLIQAEAEAEAEAEETSKLKLATARPTAEAAAPPILKSCPHRAILALWAEILPALPQHKPEMWRGSRAAHLQARWRETAVERKWVLMAEGVEFFRKLFGYVGRSSFLVGKARSSTEGRPPFQCELAWLVEPQNWAKVIEGKYHEEKAA